MSKAKKIEAFDPNGPGQTDLNIFGLPFTEDESEIVLLPVPWEVTVSYGGGTINGPDAILEASLQVDLHDSDVPEAWKSGIYMQEVNEEIRALSKSSREKAETYIESLANGASSSEYLQTIEEINAACEKMIDFVKNESSKILDSGKICGLIGGDHSTPLGYIQALAERNSSFGILQIDAHMDLRRAYEGFTYSHASIMYNALQIPQVSHLVQVGIRDYCLEEVEVMNVQGHRVKTFFDHALKTAQYEGLSWSKQVAEIINSLPEKVYLSFDIDGLDPVLCPNTGTPVPGGLSYPEAVYLIRKVVDSGRKIIGFDLNEVSPGNTDWDANVAARLLLKQCVFAGKSVGIFN
ncbi:MAG: agmatinase family protein [Bacteroidia bacterium]